MEKISILITGDFVPYGRILDLLNEGRYNSVFNDFYEKLLNTDINITNLECPLVTNAKPISKIGPSLKAPLETVELLKYGRFNVVTLANNHILDYGKVGLKSTINNCQKNKIFTVGAGLSNDEVTKPLILEIKNRKIAIFNFAEREFSVVKDIRYGANPLEFKIAYQQINELKRSTDFVLVIVHGGHEFYKYPSPDTLNRYRNLIDIGADTVIAHHPHVFSGYETYQNKLIFYSLGNFTFDWQAIDNPKWYEGYAIKLMLDENNKINFDIIPYKQGSEIPGIKLLNNIEEDLFHKEIKTINEIISNDDKLKNEWKKYVELFNAKYMSLIQPTPKIIQALQRRHLLPNIFYKSKYNRSMLLNLIRCESHRELLMEILEDSTLE